MRGFYGGMCLRTGVTSDRLQRMARLQARPRRVMDLGSAFRSNLIKRFDSRPTARQKWTGQALVGKRRGGG
jgi:hypothetical protein